MKHAAMDEIRRKDAIDRNLYLTRATPVAKAHLYDPISPAVQTSGRDVP
jgi:hypothetical protein